MKYTLENGVLSFTIPLPPVSKKNSQQILYRWSEKKQKQVPFIAPSRQYKVYEHNAMLLCPRVTVDGPVNIRCLFYMPAKIRVDLVNLLEAIDDVLVKRGILPDDNCTVIVSHDGSRVYCDKQNPRTEIFISEVKNEQTEDH